MDGEKSVALANTTLGKYDYPVMEQDVSVAQTSFRTSVICVGILLNCVVLFVVIFSRQLHYPRHIFWAAISIFECLFLVDTALELETVLRRDYFACRFVVLFYPVDYSILLICVSLAALDRYLSIVRYDWYQVNVTNRGAIVSITIATGITYVIFTCPFWTGYRSIYTCTVNIIHSVLAFTWNLFLGIVCLVLHFKIFVETKSLIRRYVPKYRRKPVTVKFENKSFIRQPSNISSDPSLKNNETAEQILSVVSENPSVVGGENPSIFFQDAEFTQTHVSHHQDSTDECHRDSHLPLVSQAINNLGDTESFPWMPNRSKVNRLEVQAALNLSVNILPFWLCAFPVSCNIIVFYWCIRLDANCDSLMVTLNYFWETFMLHSIYNPIMYIATCSEFQRAFLRIANKWFNKFRFAFRK
ncbi:hypothetical protein DAPPUDRAFT_101081 [Daphnia pulex]|uniref:G-protein coupled receptors family 1 profile domain-containing protein n=1 Tax=Daphnia pulex TaxID=6669 RepID=E9GC97_DAPPU|nr:hypothetical protein DAPPUDRAFT_101081 [Daphnia pulex]|eukprot:EFX82897.1 hypothetical protein DAPPUDRAFT_101081 [Daphnia pulex]